MEKSSQGSLFTFEIGLIHFWSPPSWLSGGGGVLFLADRSFFLFFLAGLLLHSLESFGSEWVDELLRFLFFGDFSIPLDFFLALSSGGDIAWPRCDFLAGADDVCSLSFMLFSSLGRGEDLFSIRPRFSCLDDSSDVG